MLLTVLILLFLLQFKSFESNCDNKSFTDHTKNKKTTQFEKKKNEASKPAYNTKIRRRKVLVLIQES